MCGIFGYISSKKINVEPLIKSIAHRGPDNQSIEELVMKGRHVGLGHRRLSIIDISTAAHQPMWNQDKTAVIVFNGEIYNFLDIKEELMAHGYSFSTKSDTEVILASYDMWAEACVEHFNGMFAFVIVDLLKNRLYGARDRFGKKPFFYYQKNDEFAFSSELKPIMLYPGFVKDINTRVLGSYMKMGYIPSPDTIFNNTHKLPAGSWFVLDNNQIQIQNYWNPTSSYHEFSKQKINGFKEAKKELNQLLTASVERRMIADVPLGSFLSSGIDSSLITAVAQKISKNPLKTFTIGINDNTLNEAHLAKKIANYLNTDHQELYLDSKEMIDLVESIPDFYDEPFGDSSQVAAMMVSKLAKSEITVALTGDGGDEIFCGYPQYDFVKKAQQMEPIGSVLRVLLPERFTALLPRRMRRVLDNINPDFKTQFFTKEYIVFLDSLFKDTISSPFYTFEGSMGIKDWQLRRMVLDMQTSLIDDMLQKVDRASMRFALETRSPLLDYTIAEFSFRIPQKFKHNNGIKKFILKELAYEYIPKGLLDNPKRGFSIPALDWLRIDLNERFEYFCESSYVEKQNLFTIQGVDQIKKILYENQIDKQYLPWHYFMFQLWYEKYIN